MEESKSNEENVESQEIDIAQAAESNVSEKRDQLPNILLIVALLFIIAGLAMIKF
jgi:hypothetical protein